jgi:hypothetical protein
MGVQKLATMLFFWGVDFRKNSFCLPQVEKSNGTWQKVDLIVL